MARETISFKGEKEIWQNFTLEAKRRKQEIWNILEPFIKTGLPFVNFLDSLVNQLRYYPICCIMSYSTTMLMSLFIGSPKTSESPAIVPVLGMGYPRGIQCASNLDRAILQTPIEESLMPPKTRILASCTTTEQA